MPQSLIILTLILLAYSIWISWTLFKRTREKWDIKAELDFYKRSEEVHLANMTDLKKWREYFQKQCEGLPCIDLIGILKFAVKADKEEFAIFLNGIERYPELEKKAEAALVKHGKIPHMEYYEILQFAKEHKAAQ